MNRLQKFLTFASTTWAATYLLQSGHAAPTNTFGFAGPEIFPIDPAISQLHAADLDGDGLTDLIVVNNARSKINLLYNNTGRTNTSGPSPVKSRRELNVLPPDARFRIESIASEKRIAALVVADLNGDGRPDLAYYGDPKELIVQYNQGTNGWSPPKRWPLTDGQLSANALVTGDLNGDGRTDLILLGETCVYLLAQLEDHSLGEPRKIPFSGTVKGIQVLDVDGDGRNDLLLVNWEDRNPFRLCRQKSDGSLGPQLFFPSPPIRSYWADNLETNSGVQLVSITANSGRAQISAFKRKPAGPLSGTLREGQFQVLPLTRTDKARRGQLWADANGDGLADLLVAEPESGQISIYFQEKDGALAAARTFPTLAGVSDLAVADWSGEGRPDIFLLSPDERQIGIARLDEGQHLPFPTLIPLEGKPLAMAVGPLRPGAKPTLAVILDQDGKRSLFTRTADGKSHTQKLSDSFLANPVSLTFHDLDQDGLSDLVILIPYEKVKVLRQVPGKDFEELSVEPPGGGLAQPWSTTLDVDGDGKTELLLPQKNFLRAVVMEPETRPASSTNKLAWMFRVKEQINGAASNSGLVGATALPNGTNAIPSLFLLDSELKVLSLCERDRLGVWQVVRNLPLPVSESTRLQPVALGGPGQQSIALMGLNTVSWQRLGGEVWELNLLDSYETPIKDGFLNDVVSGDLNQDGRKDLVFLETARNYLDLVLFSAQHKFVPANRWPVFEERSFRARRNDLPEPREALVADVTGDGKNDLIVLVHDRILVYPQE